MAFGFTKIKSSPIAVDFGSDSIKVLQIVPTNPPQLIAAASVPIPDHARTDTISRMAFVSEALKNLLDTQPFKGKRAILSIPAFQTIVQHMAIPGNAQDNIEFEIGLNLQQRLNINPNRMIIRHFPCINVVKNGSTQQEIICIAAMKDIIMQYLELAAKCKLDVVGMHSEPVCMLKAFEQLQCPQDTSTAQCYIDIGSATTKVVIAHGSEMVFTKAIHAAGEQFNRQLSVKKKVAYCEARQARIAHAHGIDLEASLNNVLAQSQGGSSHVNDISAQAVIPMAKNEKTLGRREGDKDSIEQETIECLIDEVQMCLRHYHSLFPDKQVQKLIFLGGESNHTNVCQQIAQGVRIAAQLGDPFARLARIGLKNPPIGVDLDQPQPGWAVPMGLCMSEANI
ncbi:pilus assembly protein PilM [Planctomycetota bacterium]|nr:pilus assembly protein PilM [Planctomycetota bacterium]